MLTRKTPLASGTSQLARTAKPRAKSNKPKRTEFNPTKEVMFVSETLRAFARGRDCQMRSEWCTNGPAVLCHSRRRATAGMGQKPHDFWGYHGCDGCHRHEDKIEDRELYDAIRRTQWLVYAHFGTLTP